MDAQRVAEIYALEGCPISAKDAQLTADHVNSFIAPTSPEELVACYARQDLYERRCDGMESVEFASHYR